jgi:hypothetical protein
MTSTMIALFCLFVAFMITALEPRLTARSVRVNPAQPTDGVPPTDVAPPTNSPALQPAQLAPARRVVAKSAMFAMVSQSPGHHSHA